MSLLIGVSLLCNQHKTLSIERLRFGGFGQDGKIIIDNVWIRTSEVSGVTVAVFANVYLA